MTRPGTVPISTPIAIQTMLHIYGICEPLRQTEGVKSIVHSLLAYDLIEPVDGAGSGFECTKRGVAWVTMLLATPLPQVAIVDPRTKEPVTTKRFAPKDLQPTCLTDAKVPVTPFADTGDF